MRDMHTRMETETSLPAWAHPAQKPNLVSFPSGKTALGSASALDSLQGTGSDLPNWEDWGRNLLLAHWGQGACCLSCCFPPASCKGHASCGRESCSCSPHECCGSHWGHLPAVLSPLFPLAEDGGSLHPRMKCLKLGKVSSPPCGGLGMGSCPGQYDVKGCLVESS